MKMSKNLKMILYIASVLIVVCLVLLLGNHLPILAKGAIMTTAWLPSVFGLYDGNGPLKINLSKEREKHVWDYCKIIYSACISLVLNLYYWSLASNSWFFD